MALNAQSENWQAEIGHGSSTSADNNNDKLVRMMREMRENRARANFCRQRAVACSAYLPPFDTFIEIRK